MSVAKKLSNISLDDTFSISTVLSNIPTKALTELYLADNRESERNTNIKKTDLKKAIIPAITVSATKYLVENLSLAQLQEAVAPLKIDHEKKKNNPNSKKVLSKRLNETLVQMGIAEYLEQHAGLELLKSISVGLELAPTSSKTDLINQITEAVEAEGLRVYFSSFSEELLRDVAFDMKLENDPVAITSKQVLVECILHNHEVPEREEKKKEKIKVSKTKPEIRKGVAYQDVFQHYYVEELHDWCKKNGLKTSGSKPDLIRRILAFLDGDKENTLAGQRRIPKRKKSATPKKATKKAPAKKEVEEDAEEVAPPKKEVGKKAAPAPKVEDPDLDDDEEEADEEEMDLDDLNKYSIAFLKKYCDEEGLTVKGTKKADYVSAIDEYNSPQDGEEDEDEEEH